MSTEEGGDITAKAAVDKHCSSLFTRFGNQNLDER